MFYPNYHQILTDYAVNQPAYKQALAEHGILSAVEPQAFAAALVDETSNNNDTDDGNTNIKKYYVFNQTGNILISSTSDGDINPDAEKLFNEVSVFFAAVTKALSSKQKTLYDYTAIEQVLGSSGVLVMMHQEDRTFSLSSTDVSLNVGIITGILGDISLTGVAMQVAKNVVASIGDAITVSVQSSSSDKKVGNLLFVCEYLLGMPLVTIQLFEVDANELVTIAKSNCDSYVSTNINFSYHQDTYLFVDPDYIKQFSGLFESTPDFDKLVQTLAGYIQ